MHLVFSQGKREHGTGWKGVEMRGRVTWDRLHQGGEDSVWIKGRAMYTKE